jgi:hypothetical protein
MRSHSSLLTVTCLALLLTGFVGCSVKTIIRDRPVAVPCGLREPPDLWSVDLILADGGCPYETCMDTENTQMLAHNYYQLMQYAAEAYDLCGGSVSDAGILDL